MSSLPASKTPPLTPPVPRTAASCAVRYLDREVVFPSSALTLEGFRAWAVSDECPEFGRFSFLNGELSSDLGPEESTTHNQVKLEIGAVLYSRVKKQRLGVFFPDRTLLTNEQAHLSTEPDSLFASWETLESGRLVKVPLVDDPERSKELQGTPDWVLEIISDSSVNKDRERLRGLYFWAGIPEYWIIDARGEEIVFQILRRGATDYEEAEVSRGGWQTSEVFKRKFRLTRERDRLNLWVYTLAVKPIR
jgi:Uma2 family endonuclease